MPLSVVREPINKKNVVVIGGSFAGLTAVRHLHNRPEISLTLVEPKDFFEYTPSVHHVLAGNQDLQSITAFWTSCVPKGVNVVRGEVTEIDQKSQTIILKNEQTISYDYLICATGGSYASPVKGAISLEERKREIRDYCEKVKESNMIACIGAGLVGVEVACEIRDMYPDKQIFLLDLLPVALATLPTRAQKYAHAYLEKLGIQLRLGQKSKIQGNTITFESGEILDCDLIMWCCGSRPYVHISEDEGMTSRLGYTVNDNLQVAGLPNVYSCGDCADGSALGAMKTAYVAEEMGKVAAKNVLKSIENKTQISYPMGLYGVPKPPTMVLVSLGTKNCIMVLDQIVLCFSFLLYFKHFIAWSKMKQTLMWAWADYLWHFGEFTTGWLHFFLFNIESMYSPRE